MYANWYLKLSRTDVDLTEKSVHDVTREKKDINMAYLIITNLEDKNS